jgi:uncharacterized membrane protein
VRHDDAVPPEPAVAPTRTDPFVSGASELIGGPVGRHVVRARRFWTPLRVVLGLTLLTCVLGYAQKAPCRTSAWAHEYQYTHMCYTDVFALYYSEKLVNGEIPYRDSPVEYPVLIGGAMLFAQQVARVFPVAERPQRFFDVTALLLLVGALVVAWTTLRLAGRRRPWDAAMVALSPVLLLHAYTNWDLLAVAFTGLGMYAWARRRPAWAGVAFGLGVATKLYPLLVLAALLLVCLRSRRLRAWAVAVGAAALAWAVVDVPIWVLYPANFGRFYALNASRGADWDSIWFVLQHWIHWFEYPAGVQPTGLNLTVGLTFAVLAAAVVWLVFSAPQRPRIPQVAFLLLLAFLLSNKVFSPQYALWLLPLAVLARPRWPAIVIWQLTEVWLLFTRFYFFVGVDKPGQGLPIDVFLLSVLARDAALLVLAGLVIREIRHPELDSVRGGAVDDPTGGVLNDAGERRTLFRPGLSTG